MERSQEMTASIDQVVEKECSFLSGIFKGHFGCMSGCRVLLKKAVISTISFMKLF